MSSSGGLGDLGGAALATRRLAGMVALLGLLVPACQPTRGAPSGGAVSVPATPTEVERPRAPLTSLPVANRSMVDRPVLAAKISNAAAQRPQTGLSAADVVFELLVDDDHTRFLALFHSELPEVVGPLRSTRLTDAPLIAPYNPLFTAEAADGRIQSAMRAFGIVPVLPQDRPEAFVRVDRPAGPTPAGIYVRTPAALQGVQGRVPPAPAVEWRFAARLAESGCGEELEPGACRTSAAPVVRVEMAPGATVTWRYDRQAGLYRRLQNGGPHTDADGRPIMAANVVIIPIVYRFEACCEDLDVPLEQTEVIGGGPATLLRDGRRMAGRWTKSDPAQQLGLLSEAGRPLALKPGRTWIELPPLDRNDHRGGRG